VPRMSILNSVEQEAFESAPVFNSFQRKQYFDYPQDIVQAAASLRTPANQLCFLLSCGSFKRARASSRRRRSMARIWFATFIIDNRKQLRLAGEPAGSSAVKKWRVRSRPLLYALSRGERANVYLPERKLDPIGIECGGRWMWILAEGDNPPSVGRAATGGSLNVNSICTTNGTG
jgi:hypothetical protein